MTYAETYAETYAKKLAERMYTDSFWENDYPSQVTFVAALIEEAMHQQRIACGCALAEVRIKKGDNIEEVDAVLNAVVPTNLSER
jgi:hypothetical protein